MNCPALTFISLRTEGEGGFLVITELKIRRYATQRTGVVLMNFEVFGNVVKQNLSRLMYLLHLNEKKKRKNIIVKIYVN